MVEDHIQQMARSLRNIEKYLATSNLGGGGGGGGGAANRRFLSPSGFVVKESDDLDSVPKGGSVTLQPGETKTLVEAETVGDGQLAILAVGATDEQNVTYELVTDYNKVIGGQTNSPLGLLNTPFSFVDTLGGAIPAASYVEYRATLDSSASTSVELGARMFVEMGGD